MCGIVAIYGNNISDIDLFNSLTEISHRGPDNLGISEFKNSGLILGHVRLSIIDISNDGNQPMTSSCGRFSIVFNGEIYNHLELREKISKDFGFNVWISTCDTETILEGFRFGGVAFLRELNGIFALLIFDSKEQKLFVLRDSLGVKPLYITCQNNNYYFCSEVKAFFEISGVKASTRIQSLAEQLLHCYVPEPNTMYEEIFRVEPGVLFTYHNFVLEKKENIKPSFLPRLNRESGKSYVNHFNDLFSNAVKRQVIADVPISLLLSGGLDSSAIAYEAKKWAPQISEAYTIVTTNSDNDIDYQQSDYKYAQKMAKTLGIQLNVIELNKDDVFSRLENLVYFMEDGITDPAAINTFFICEAAKKDGYRVLLSGQGADEFLMGYRRYTAEKYLEKISPFEKEMIRFSNLIIPSGLPGKLNGLKRRLDRLEKLQNETEKYRMLNYFSGGNFELLKDIFLEKNLVNRDIELLSMLERLSGVQGLEKMLAIDEQFDLRSLNLNYTDKMSMANSIEVRVPFLDLPLVDFMRSLPISYLLRGRETKHILRKAMIGKLPNSIINRSKTGFAMPIRSWMKNSEIVDHYLNFSRINEQGLFDPTEVQRLIKLNNEGTIDASYIIFSMVLQQIWLEKVKY